MTKMEDALLMSTVPSKKWSGFNDTFLHQGYENSWKRKEKLIEQNKKTSLRKTRISQEHFNQEDNSSSNRKMAQIIH